MATWPDSPTATAPSPAAISSCTRATRPTRRLRGLPAREPVLRVLHPTASPAGAASVSCWPVKRASLPTRTAGNVGEHFGAPHVHRRPVHEQVTRAGRGGHRRRRAHLVRHRPQVVGVLAGAGVDPAELSPPPEENRLPPQGPGGGPARPPPQRPQAGVL